MSKIKAFAQLLKSRQMFILFLILRIVAMLAGLLSNVLIVRKLSVGDYGIFSIVLTLVGFITTFGFSWSSSSIIYFGSQELTLHGNMAKTFWSRSVIIVFSLMLTSFGIIVFKDPIYQYLGIKITYLLLIWLILNVIEDYLSQYFLTVKRQVISSLLPLTWKILFLLAILIFDFNVRQLIVINIICNSSIIFFIFGINRKEIGQFEFDTIWFKKILHFSLWQLFGFSGLYLINYGDIFIIKHFLDFHSIAVYNVAYKLFNNIADFSFVISSFFAAQLAEYYALNDQSNIIKFFYKERLYILGVGSIAHLMTIFFAKPIIVMLFGQEYISAVPIFSILMLGSLVRYISVFYMIYFNVSKQYSTQQTINIIQAVLNIFLSILFIQRIGLIGPAIATVVSLALTSLYSGFICEKSRFGLKNMHIYE